MQRQPGFDFAVSTTAGAKRSLLDTRGTAAAAMQAAVQQHKAGLTDWTGFFCVHDLAEAAHGLIRNAFLTCEILTVDGGMSMRVTA